MLSSIFVYTLLSLLSLFIFDILCFSILVCVVDICRLCITQFRVGLVSATSRIPSGTTEVRKRSRFESRSERRDGISSDSGVKFRLREEGRQEGPAGSDSLVRGVTCDGRARSGREAQAMLQGGVRESGAQCRTPDPGAQCGPRPVSHFRKLGRPHITHKKGAAWKVCH